MINLAMVVESSSAIFNGTPQTLGFFGRQYDLKSEDDQMFRMSLKSPNTKMWFEMEFVAGDASLEDPEATDEQKLESMKKMACGLKIMVDDKMVLEALVTFKSFGVDFEFIIKTLLTQQLMQEVLGPALESLNAIDPNIQMCYDISYTGMKDSPVFRIRPPQTKLKNEIEPGSLGSEGHVLLRY